MHDACNQALSSNKQYLCLAWLVHAETIFCHMNQLSEHGLKIYIGSKMTAAVKEAVIQFTEAKIELYEIIEV